MNALNSIGQLIIDDAVQTRIVNKIKIFDLLITILKDKECKKNSSHLSAISLVYHLINESKHASFIAIRGSEPLIVNERLDAENHNRLDGISKEVYKVFEELQRKELISYEGNVSNFEWYKIRKKLSQIFIDITYTE